MGPPFRILHVLGSGTHQGSGVAQIVEALARGLDPTRYALSAIFLGERGALEESLEEAGVAVYNASWSRGAQDVAGAVGFWRCLRSLPVDLVHQHFGGRSVQWMLRRSVCGPLLVHLHGMILEAHPRSAPRTFVDSADAAIAVSKAVAAWAGLDDTCVVYPGVTAGVSPIAGNRRADPRDPVLGCAGRLVPVKGLVHLLEAVALMQPEFPSLQLQIAGAGTDRDALQAQARKLGIAERVAFLGWVSDLSATMARWTIFVQPSTSEGLGVSVLEAMAVGLPVVATRVGGLPEVVEDGTTGSLVPPASGPALASAISVLLRSADVRGNMGAAGHRRVVDQFTNLHMVNAVAAIYERLLRREQRRGTGLHFSRMSRLPRSRGSETPMRARNDG
jgi:glycosyltransferase involved in cell wall biosynthesis